MPMSESALGVVFAAPTFMTVALFLHIAGGSVGLASGFTAVLVRKGETAHRVVGTAFFVAMLTMGTFAAVIAALKGQTGNFVGGVSTVYFVATAWMTVRRAEGAVGRFEVFAFLVAAVIAVLSILKGLQPGVDATGLPNAISAVFGSVVAIAAIGDLKVLLQRGVSGAGRISRHLWRMCFALFVASGSFFLSQMEVVFPGSAGPWIWLPAFAPFGFLVFWLVRVRIGRAFKSVPAAA